MDCISCTSSTTSILLRLKNHHDERGLEKLKTWEEVVDKWFRQKQRNFFNSAVECTDLQDRIQLRLHDLHHVEIPVNLRDQIPQLIQRLEEVENKIKVLK